MLAPVAAKADDEQNTQTLADLSDAFAGIAERVTPSVVNISCLEPEGVSSEEEQASDSDAEEGDASDDEYGYGSGVVIDPAGYILTSNHVVESATRIDVKLSDNQKYAARLVGQDSETDLALIKVDPVKPLPAALLGDSSHLKPGQLVLAIGNPFVYDHTVTLGVISALNRDLGTNIFDSFIQTDAAINFGNSGGPLLNTHGEVIGINTLISSQGTGIGFAVPINTAKEIIPQLKAKGRVSRGYLGLVPQEITPELQKSLNLQTAEGIVISSVQRGTPAEQAGLHRYDVILEVEGTKIATEDQFRRLVALMEPGKAVNMKVQRETSVLSLTAKIAERPETPPRKAAPPEKGDNNIGMELQNLTPRLRQDYRISEDDAGVLVKNVTPGNAAFEAGLEKGDLIVEVNKRPVGDVARFEKLVHSCKAGDVLLLYVYRDSNYQLFTLQIQ